MNTSLGQFNPLAIAFFYSLPAHGITYWAARRTKSTEQFYTAGGNITGFQNGLCPRR